jgi:hypothetical protein
MAATTGECSTLAVVRRTKAGDNGYSKEEEPRASRLDSEDSRCMGMIWGQEGGDTFISTLSVH